MRTIPTLVAFVVLSASALAQRDRPTTPTFTKEVAPILFKHCVRCHRPGEAAPMSLFDVRANETVREGNPQRRVERHDAALAR